MKIAFSPYRTARACERMYFREQHIRSQRRAAGIVSALLLVLASIICMRATAVEESATQEAVRPFQQVQHARNEGEVRFGRGVGGWVASATTFGAAQHAIPCA